MKRIMVFAIMACGMLSAVFAASIENVVVRQQWPWSPKVNVDYRLVDPTGGAHDVKVTFKNGDTEIVTEYGSITGDQFGVEQGDHRLVWDPQFGGDHGYENVYPNLTATVSIDDDEKLYMIVDISAGGGAGSFPVTFTNKVPSGGWNVDEYKWSKIVLRKIPAGTFVMGYTDEEISHYSNNIYTGFSNDFFLRRKVTLTKPYYIALFPVTLRQHNLMGEASDPGWHYGYPVSSGVTYAMLRGASADDAAIWPNLQSDSILGRLNAKTASSVQAALPGYRFDLPTHAQWECACRAGTTTCFNNGKNWAPDGTNVSDANLDEVAWYACGGTTRYVGQKAPNGFGLYDMHGHVLEFIRDMMSSANGRSNGVTNPETDPLLRGNYYDRAWGCGGRASGGAVECMSNTASLIGLIDNNYNISSCVGYRLALVAD